MSQLDKLQSAIKTAEDILESAATADMTIRTNLKQKLKLRGSGNINVEQLRTSLRSQVDPHVDIDVDGDSIIVTTNNPYNALRIMKKQGLNPEAEAVEPQFSVDTKGD